MRLPAEVRDGLDQALEQMDAGRIRAVEPVGGGCIADTARLITAGEASFFVKWSAADDGPVGMFDAEARSLTAIADTGVIRAPAVLNVRDGSDRADQPRWLLLEWLEPGHTAAHTWPYLAGALCDLHRTRGERWGWPAHNFIGRLPQRNDERSDWSGFWTEQRLEPQLRLACDNGLLDREARKRFERLYAALPEILAPAEADGPSLLHGDLWSGNLHVQRGGDPALIDPASYHGHREVDLAMTHLFGGFDSFFHAAYHERWPLAPGHERRRMVYQLYYLLVHVNLFGAGYRSRTLAALSSAGF